MNVGTVLRKRDSIAHAFLEEEWPLVRRKSCLVRKSARTGKIDGKSLIRHFIRCTK
jgi:hypothetical protein